MTEPARKYTDDRRYGIGPDGVRKSWFILGTVPGARGPFTETRTVVYGPWRAKGEPDPRVAAIADLEHVMALALQAMSENDACADPDDPDWRGPAIDQFRRDLTALGVTPAELDAAGIKRDTP
jgi:hypothetical protein